jgi:hypothetical protein
MSPEETQRHPLKGLSMGITIVVLAIAVWHGLFSLLVLMIASYTRNLLFLLLLVAAVTPFIILFRRVRGVEWSGSDLVLTGLAVIPGAVFTLWVTHQSNLLSRTAVIASEFAYAIAFAGAIHLARHRAFH